MRRVTKPGARRRGSGQEIVVRHDAGSRSPKRTAAATDIGLLGQGCGETLPSLRRVPTSYRLETNGERLYRLCLALVERNLADEKLWQKSGNVAVVFARKPQRPRRIFAIASHRRDSAPPAPGQDGRDARRLSPGDSLRRCGGGTEGFHRNPAPAVLYQWRQQFAWGFECRHRVGRRSPGCFRYGVRQAL